MRRRLTRWALDELRVHFIRPTAIVQIPADWINAGASARELLDGAGEVARELEEVDAVALVVAHVYMRSIRGTGPNEVVEAVQWGNTQHERGQIHTNGGVEAGL